jgi:hypothetical protein
MSSSIGDGPSAGPTRIQIGGGVSGPGAHWGGGGYLVVAPGELRYELDPIMRRLNRVDGVRHVRPEVIVVRARLLPPPLNRSVLVLGRDRYARLLAWWGIYGRVAAALRDAGYVIDERKTWITLGWRIGREEMREARTHL